MFLARVLKRSLLQGIFGLLGGLTRGKKKSDLWQKI